MSVQFAISNLEKARMELLYLKSRTPLKEQWIYNRIEFWEDRIAELSRKYNMTEPIRPLSS